MQLDQTHIAIRRRSMLEICDLSLHVMRDHLVPFLVLLSVGVAPWMLLNYFLIGWMISGEYAGLPGMTMLYWWSMFLLVCGQAQIATVFVTKYLGDATFQLKPSLGSTIRLVLRSMTSLLTLHFVVRPLLFVLLFALIYLTGDMDMIAFSSVVFVPPLVLIIMVVRAFRPFVNEVILLEKTPLKTVAGNQVTYSLRNKSLYVLNGGNIFGRSMAVWLISIPTFFIFAGTMMSVKFVFGLGAELTWLSQAIVIPIALWLTAGFIAVIRFLTYIDTRIFQEGWDVELKIRAEAMKLKERLS